MTPLPIDVDQAEQQQRLERARLRLLDTAADLRPLASPEELSHRMADALRELADIIEELNLLLHVKRLEEEEIEADLLQLDQALAGGWKPDAAPADEVVAKLKAQFHLS
jgi:hypothetical protein